MRAVSCPSEHGLPQRVRALLTLRVSSLVYHCTFRCQKSAVIVCSAVRTVESFRPYCMTSM